MCTYITHADELVLTRSPYCYQILKDGMKHACRSCITGHRSSKCVHHDRELFPIAKKGRPSSQCKNCKDTGTYTNAAGCDCQKKRKSKSRPETNAEQHASSSGLPFVAADPPTSIRRKGSFSSVTGSSYPPSEDNYNHYQGRTQVSGEPLA